MEKMVLLANLEGLLEPHLLSDQITVADIQRHNCVVDLSKADPIKVGF